ncbi:VSIG4 protein, partial [Thryothorus ludovicianus]|nr:VSIG4 protein [Thryothorus ludovicianus]
AFPDLSGPSEIKGVWKEPVTLPCTYVPVEDLVQQTLTWTVVHDKDSRTIFRRDGSSDHILLSEYRERVSIPKDDPGNVSLLILSLEISDRGTYTCQVTWRDSNNSLIAKEITTKLEVVKENRAGAGAVQRSDAVQLTVTDSQRPGLSLYLVILIAVVCGAVVFLVISLIICIRKPKD